MWMELEYWNRLALKAYNERLVKFEIFWLNPGNVACPTTVIVIDWLTDWLSRWIMKLHRWLVGWRGANSGSDMDLHLAKNASSMLRCWALICSEHCMFGILLCSHQELKIIQVQTLCSTLPLLNQSPTVEQWWDKSQKDELSHRTCTY